MVFQAIFVTKADLIHSVYAGTALPVDNQTDFHDMTGHLSFMEDQSGTLTFEEVARQTGENQWHQISGTSINFGYTNSAFWFMFQLINTEPDTIANIIEIAYPVLDHIDLYQVTADGQVHHTIMGDKQPFHLRPILYRNFTVPVKLSPNRPVTIFIRVKTSSSMQIPITLWKENAWMSYNLNDSLNLGIFFGVMLIMGLYNLFVFISVREIYYLFYVCFVFSMTLFLASLKGLSFQYLWPESVLWNDQSIIIGLAGAIFFGAFFIRDFINLPANRPIFNKFMLFIAALCLIIVVATFFMPYHIMIQWVILVAVIWIAGATVIAIIRWKDGDASARYFMLAWSAMMFGGIILAANKFNLIPRNLFTENATSYGMALQVILLSIALAERLNSEKRNSLAAQMEAYKQEKIARKARENALKIQKRANEMLEQRVQERTTELQKANELLETLSITDGLTGIKNRRYFDEAYPHEFQHAVREGTPLALLMLDIDHFKIFNDTHGHLMGDECLKMVAAQIKNELHRVTDMAFRFGGEEFCVLLPNTENKGAAIVAERIRKQIETADLQYKGRKTSVTISIGLVSHIPSRKLHPDVLISNADKALYQSKQGGRNRITVYNLTES